MTDTQKDIDCDAAFAEWAAHRDWLLNQPEALRYKYHEKDQRLEAAYFEAVRARHGLYAKPRRQS